MALTTFLCHFSLEKRLSISHRSSNDICTYVFLFCFAFFCCCHFCFRRVLRFLKVEETIQIYNKYNNGHTWSAEKRNVDWDTHGHTYWVKYDVDSNSKTIHFYKLLINTLEQERARERWNDAYFFFVSLFMLLLREFCVDVVFISFRMNLFHSWPRELRRARAHSKRLFIRFRCIYELYIYLYRFLFHLFGWFLRCFHICMVWKE